MSDALSGIDVETTALDGCLAASNWRKIFPRAGAQAPHSGFTGSQTP